MKADRMKTALEQTVPVKRAQRALLITGLLTLVAVAAPLGLRGLFSWTPSGEAGQGAMNPLELDTSTEVLLSGDERAGAAYERVQAMLGGQTMVCVLLRDEALLSNEGIARIRGLGERLSTLPGVTDIKSLTHSWRPVRKQGFSLDPRELIGLKPMVPLEPIPEAGWAEVRRFVTAYPLARDLFISRDGSWALVMLTLERELAQPAQVAALKSDVQAVIDESLLAEAVQEVHVLGFPFIEAEVRETVREDVRAFAGSAAAGAAVILLLSFRSLALLGAVLAFMAAGLAALPLVLRLTGASLNVYTAMLIPLIAGLQLSILTHFVSAFQRALRESAMAAAQEPDHAVRPGAGRGAGNARQAAARALQLVSRPSGIALATSAIGLLSLLVCDVDIVREFGGLGAWAVVAVSLVTFLPLWLLARSADRGADRTLSPAPPCDASAAMTNFVRWAGRQRLWLSAASLSLVVICLPGVLNLRTDVRATEFLNPDSPGRQGLARLDEHLGGVHVFHLELACGTAGGAAAPETLQFLEDLRHFAEEQPGVTNVYSYALIMGLVNQVWTGDESAELKLPATPLLSQLFTGGLRSLKWSLLDNFLDADGKRTAVVIRTHDMPGPEYLALLETFMAFAEEECPEGVSLDVQRGIHDILEADRRLVESQLQSLGLCVLAIFLAVALLWWSWRAAVLSVLVNVPALAVVGGLMSWADLPLNSITVMVSAVVLGIAVDDSIHWLGTYRRESRSTLGMKGAVARTMGHKLKPMICTTGMLVAGLSILTFSRFPPVADFGLLASAALLVSLASSLILLPALVTPLVGRDFCRAGDGPSTDS